MKTTSMILLGIAIALFLGCQNKKDTYKKQANLTKTVSKNSTAERGSYLVEIMDCNACHTPKTMTLRGPVLDKTRLLSGYPDNRPVPKYDQEVAAKGVLFYHPDLTASAGPWGISFAANLTPDVTGIGSWSLEQFSLAMREGKHKGLAGSRNLLPPMPWEAYSYLTDDDIEAIFNYLRSLSPIDNVVPAAVFINKNSK